MLKKKKSTAPRSTCNKQREGMRRKIYYQIKITAMAGLLSWLECPPVHQNLRVQFPGKAYT